MAKQLGPLKVLGNATFTGDLTQSGTAKIVTSDGTIKYTPAGVAPTVGQVLKATNVDGTASWADVGDTMQFTSATKTANYTLALTDGLIEADGAAGTVDISIPTWAAGYRGKLWIIECKDAANAVTVKLQTPTDKLDGTANGTIVLGTGDHVEIYGGYSGANYRTF